VLQLGGDVEQPWLTSKYDVIHKKRKYQYKTYHYAATATAIDNRHKKYGEDQTCSSKDMIMETQTHTQRGTCSSQYSASYRERSNKTQMQVIELDDAISSAKITRCEKQLQAHPVIGAAPTVQTNSRNMTPY